MINVIRIFLTQQFQSKKCDIVVESFFQLKGPKFNPLPITFTNK